MPKMTCILSLSLLKVETYIKPTIEHWEGHYTQDERTSVRLLLLRSLIFSKTMNPPCKCQLSTPLEESLISHHMQSHPKHRFLDPQKSQNYSGAYAAVSFTCFIQFLFYTKTSFSASLELKEQGIFMFPSKLV